MKKLLFFTLSTIILVSTAVEAQNIVRYREMLMTPSQAYGSRIVVREHGVAESAINTISRRNASNGAVAGYRVLIFSDNSQYAGSKADAAASRFRSSFPGINVYSKYEAPDFKVTVGDCLTYDEVLILWGRAKAIFDRATIQQADIPLSLFETTYDFMGAQEVVAETGR